MKVCQECKKEDRKLHETIHVKKSEIKCEDIPYKTCQMVDKKHCKQVPETVCKLVEKCWDEPKAVCNYVDRCWDEPRQVCNYVEKKVCHDPKPRWRKKRSPTYQKPNQHCGSKS